MSAGSTKQMRQLLKIHRDWLQRDGDHVLRMGQTGANESFAEDAWTAIKILPCDFSQLATFHGIRGGIDLIDGNVLGWQSIDTSVFYHFWQVKLTAKAFFQQAFLGQFRSTAALGNCTSETACLLAYSMVHDLDNWRKEVHDILIGMATVPDAVPEHYWKVRVFEPFMLRLHQKAYGGNLPDDIQQRDLGPYAEILTHRDQADLLAEPLTKICDYHCKNMIDRGGDWDPEFKHAPFDLYPVEILAVYKIRNQLGLETPKIDHPLLATPLASLEPRSISPIDDPIIHRVERLYQEFFGTTA